MDISGLGANVYRESRKKAMTDSKVRGQGFEECLSAGTRKRSSRRTSRDAYASSEPEDLMLYIPYDGDPKKVWDYSKADNAEEASRTETEIVIKPDGSRVLVVTMHTGGSVRTLLKVKLSEPADMPQDEGSPVSDGYQWEETTGEEIAGKLTTLQTAY